MRRPTAIGGYVFAGGFTLGVAKHFDVLAHLEADAYGVPTTLANFPGLPVYYPVERWAENHDRPDLIYGNPPCAAWSSIGKAVGHHRTGHDWRHDPRVGCTRNLFRLLEERRPRVWAWESVTQAFTTGHELVNDLTRRAMGLGYAVTVVLHDAQWLGVPQARRRFFMVAHRVAIPWAAHLPTFAPPLTAGQALHGIKPAERRRVNPRLTQLIRATPPGTGLRESYHRLFPNTEKNQRGQLAGAPGFAHKRLARDQPANTITGENFAHWAQARYLVWNELAALCGFPPEYVFVGSGKASQVARGVCPPVGAWLAGCVVAGLAAGRRVRRPAARLLDIRTPKIKYEELIIDDAI